MQKDKPHSNLSHSHMVYVSKEVMADIMSGSKEKYDAKRSSREARKQLRKQGLRV